MSVSGQQREDFEHWLAHMDDAIDHFLASAPAAVRTRLDSSKESLVALEEWLLERYASTDEMLVSSESFVIDGAARYVGEIFRKALGGRWELPLGDPSYVFHGRPQLVGFPAATTPVSPHSLVTAAADRRTGRFLLGVLESYLRDAQRSTG